jgi:hypothetical protein
MNKWHMKNCQDEIELDYGFGTFYGLIKAIHEK